MRRENVLAFLESEYPTSFTATEMFQRFHPGKMIHEGYSSLWNILRVLVTEGKIEKTDSAAYRAWNDGESKTP